MRLLALVFGNFFSCGFLGGSVFGSCFFGRSIGFFCGSLGGFLGFSLLRGLFLGAFLGGFARLGLLRVVARAALEDAGGIEEAVDAVARLGADSASGVRGLR